MQGTLTETRAGKLRHTRHTLSYIFAHTSFLFLRAPQNVTSRGHHSHAPRGTATSEPPAITLALPHIVQTHSPHATDMNPADTNASLPARGIRRWHAHTLPPTTNTGLAQSTRLHSTGALLENNPSGAANYLQHVFAAAVRVYLLSCRRQVEWLLSWCH